MSRLATALGATALILGSTTACTSVAANPTTAPAASAVSQPTAIQPTESPSTDPEILTSLDGTWTTPTMTSAQVRANLRDHRLGQYADTVIKDFPLPTTWSWTLVGGSYTVATADGERFDLGSYSVEAAPALLAPENLLLTLRPQCTCTIVYSVEQHDDTMTLTLVSDESPDLHGVPDEAFQRALYTTHVFTRRS